MTAPLRLLTVHAHPDDEASKGSSTVARYRDEGVESALVCCTGGEEGDILNKALDSPEIRDNLAAVRRRELQRAAEIIGYEHVHMLGYRDSGMKDTPANDHPDSFHRAPLDEAVGRLVAIVRQRRPHVIVTYADDQQGYQHPDHVRVNDISVPAFEAAGDPDAFPDLGEPWQPLKMYYTTWSRWLVSRRCTTSSSSWVSSRPTTTAGSRGRRPTTRSPPASRSATTTRSASMRCSPTRTQVDPNERFWFGLPVDVARTVHPWDDYMLARSLVNTEIPEDDLFAGVREFVGSTR